MPSTAASTLGKVTIEEINRLMKMGLNPTQVAKVLDRDKSTISHIRAENRSKAYWTPVEQVRVRWPWGPRPAIDAPPRMDGQFTEAAPCKRLRSHARWYAIGADNMSPHSVYVLNGFYRMLREHNCVVAFDPNLEPYKDMPSGGWAYVTRTPKDRHNGRDLMIRVDHNVTAKLDDYFYDQWSLPRRDIPTPS